MRSTPLPVPSWTTSVWFTDEHGRMSILRLADAYDLPLLGRILLDPTARESGEKGELVVIDDTESAAIFGDIAREVMDHVGEIRRELHRLTRTGRVDHPQDELHVWNSSIVSLSFLFGGAAKVSTMDIWSDRRS